MSRCAVCCGLLAALLSLLPAGADATAELESPRTGFRVTNPYERDDFEVDLVVNYRQAGTLLDTIGINAAPVGSFALSIGADRKVSFTIYDPQRQASGWRTWTNPQAISIGQDHRIILRVSGGRLVLRVEGELVQGDCPTTLSGQPVYLGDFKGDEPWGEKYTIYRGAVGTVTIKYWGVARQGAPTTTATPTTPTNPSEPAHSEASRAVAAETGTLSAVERQLIGVQLSRLQQEKGWSLGLVWATPDGVETKAKQYRDRWVSQRVLPSVSGVFVATDGQWFWQYNTELAGQLTFEQLDAAWREVREQPPAAALAAFVARLGGWTIDSSPANPVPNPPVETPATTTSTPTTTGPAPTTIDGWAAGLVQALQAGNAAAATAYLHPDLQVVYGKVLAQQPAVMAKLAALLGTRKAVAQGVSTAEYEVTEGGRKYPVMFLLVDGRWLLASF